MPVDTNILFIARNQSKYVQYEVEISDKSPKLLRTELDTIDDDKRPLVLELRQDVRLSELPSYLRYVTVINSVRSGTGLSNTYYFNVLLPLFKDFGIPHVCVATTSENCITNHAESFCTSGTVVLFGGDTTISEFVNGLPSTESPLQLRIMVIPTGTGNALANSIDLRSPIDAIRAMFFSDRSWTPLPAFPVQLPQHPKKCAALVVFSFGLHAGLVGDSDTTEMRKLGNERFKIAAEALVDRDPTYLAHIQGIQNNSHSYLLITTAKELEPGFEISPQSDGEHAFMLEIPKVSGARFMEIMMSAYQQGAHTNFPEVTYRQLTQELEITILDQPELERRCCIDGKIEVAQPGRVSIGLPSFKWNGWDLLIWAKPTHASA